MNRAALAAAAFIGWLVMTQIARAGSALAAPNVRALVDQVNAAEFSNWFDPLDVMAVIQVESDFDPRAYRYEPGLNDASIGLMQVLYSTALDRGLDPAIGPAALYDPLTSIRMGMRQLKWSFDFLAARLGRAPTYDEWIGSYNSGVGNILKGNANPGYVARWQGARAAQ